MPENNTLTPPFMRTQPKAEGSAFIGQNTQDDSTVLDNESFYPSISVRDFQTRFSVDNSFELDRQIHCLQLAISRTNNELTEWSCEQVRQGFNTLEDVPSPQQGNCSEKVMHYHNAVYVHAMSLLTRRYMAAADSTGKAAKPDTINGGLLLEHTADDYERQRWESLQMVMGEETSLSGAI